MDTLITFIKTLDTIILIAYVLSNVLAMVQLAGSYRWPTATRIVFLLIFGSAAVINIRTVLNTPWVYGGYADYAIPPYSWFILGPFDSITQPMVLCIAAGQTLIAGSMLLTGRWFRRGCLGGMVFCVAIAPLGLGAAFPATLLLALAFYQLYKPNRRQPVTPVRNPSQVSFPLS